MNAEKMYYDLKKITADKYRYRDCTIKRKWNSKGKLQLDEWVWTHDEHDGTNGLCGFCSSLMPNVLVDIDEVLEKGVKRYE
jgi:hypothetical protein